MPRASSSSASGLPRHDPISHALIESARDDRRQQGPRVLLGEPSERQLRQAHQLALVAGLANGEHDRHRLRQQPAGDEAEHLARDAVEPLRVVDETEQRPLLGNLSQQAERGKGHQEAVRDIA